MVKKTINFSDSKILQEFDAKIVEEYGSIRAHRTQVLEQLMEEYRTGKYDENKKKLNKYDDVLSEKEELSQYNEKLEKEIDELNENNKKLESFKAKYDEKSLEYEKVLSENNNLYKTNKNLEKNIDELNEKIETLQKEKDKLQLDNEHLQKLLSERKERISEYKSTLNSNTDTIKSLNQKITVKENEYKHLETIRNKDLEEKYDLQNKIGNFMVVFAKIEKMNFIERLAKRFPEEMKALPEYHEKTE